MSSQDENNVTDNSDHSMKQIEMIVTDDTANLTEAENTEIVITDTSNVLNTKISLNDLNDVDKDRLMYDDQLYE